MVLASELFDGRLDKLVAAAAAGVWLGDNGRDIKTSFNERAQAMRAKVFGAEEYYRLAANPRGRRCL